MRWLCGPDRVGQFLGGQIIEQLTEGMFRQVSA
jgi:hypothetical protein